MLAAEEIMHLGPETASGLALERQAKEGMAEMSRKFREMGGEVYVATEKANTKSSEHDK